MNPDVQSFLEKTCQDATVLVGNSAKISSELPLSFQKCLNEILAHSEGAKAVLTVVITSVAYKHFHPEQDIRKHQRSINGGYAGRNFDQKNITPFLKKHRFPAMSESGWLTRSLEQKAPYDSLYTGAIKPDSLKKAFIQTLEEIEKGTNCIAVLLYLFQGLVIKRNLQEIDLVKPANLPIRLIIKLLTDHFFSKYQTEGAARLPVLALYAVYQCLVKEVGRFDGKALLPLESHTSADLRSGRIGDLQLEDEHGKPFEAMEVKHGIPISAQLVRDSFEKFSKTQVMRFYLLTTKESINDLDKSEVEKEVERIKNIHGCQVIVNGVLKTLHYYLRLISNPATFISNYVDLLEQDASLKFEHKQKWNVLISLLST